MSPVPPLASVHCWRLPSSGAYIQYITPRVLSLEGLDRGVGKQNAPILSELRAALLLPWYQMDH